MPTDTDFAALQDRKAHRRVTFDPTINLGHVLTFVGFLVTGFSAYNLIDKRVTVLETKNITAEHASQAQEQRTRDTLGEIRQDIKEVRRAVEDIGRNAANKGR